MSGYRLTKKQIQILETVMKGGDAGELIDMDQLLKRLPYATSKQSMQCSIRFLEGRGLIDRKPLELRRGKWRAVFSLTPAATSLWDTETEQFDIIIEGFDEEELL